MIFGSLSSLFDKMSCSPFPLFCRVSQDANRPRPFFFVACSRYGQGFLGVLPKIVGKGALVAWLCVGITLAEDAQVIVPDVEGTQRATIIMESYTFTPNKFVVERGKPVELILRNESFLIPHNFLLDAPSGDRLVEVSVSAGESATVQFTLAEPGEYPFYCDEEFLFFPNHREEGMEGRITVR